MGSGVPLGTAGGVLSEWIQKCGLVVCTRGTSAHLMCFVAWQQTWS